MLVQFIYNIISFLYKIEIRYKLFIQINLKFLLTFQEKHVLIISSIIKYFK